MRAILIVLTFFWSLAMQPFGLMELLRGMTGVQPAVAAGNDALRAQPPAYRNAPVPNSPLGQRLEDLRLRQLRGEIDVPTAQRLRRELMQGATPDQMRGWADERNRSEAEDEAEYDRRWGIRR